MAGEYSQREVHLILEPICEQSHLEDRKSQKTVLGEGQNSIGQDLELKLFYAHSRIPKYKFAN